MKIKTISALLFITFLSMILAKASGNFLQASHAFEISVAVVSFTALLIAGMNRKQGTLGADSVDLDELTAALGDYCRQFNNDLIPDLVLDDDDDDGYTNYDGLKDELALANLSIKDIVAPMDYENFEPGTDKLKYGARILKVRDCKIDLLIYPKVYHKQWLGLSLKKGNDNEQIPFEQFLMNAIIAKGKEEVRLNARFKGVYDANGTTSSDIFDGFIQLQNDAITANTLTPTATGVITADNVIDKIELVYDALSDAAKKKPTIMRVSPTIFGWYGRKYRSLYHSSPIYKGIAQDEITIDGTNCRVKSEPGLSGSQRLFVTYAGNESKGADSTSDISNIDIQKYNRALKILIDFSVGVQYEWLKDGPCAVNDQELPGS